MFANCELVFLHIAVIRAGLQTQLESEAEDRKIGLLAASRAVSELAQASCLSGSVCALGCWEVLQGWTGERRLETWVGLGDIKPGHGGCSPAEANSHVEAAEKAMEAQLQDVTCSIHRHSSCALCTEGKTEAQSRIMALPLFLGLGGWME